MSSELDYLDGGMDNAEFNSGVDAILYDTTKTSANRYAPVGEVTGLDGSQPTIRTNLIL